ncbi:hypothetical protein AXG93_1027s1110 [Marchantia polymorpha subsp. ruderalis]|uniref:Uncharacterized protein n=1 Tax=Marchantia polymorpha subsp. ruderalis TaxID=1480154 RepID=A0A176W1N1_MARPO|nr:hypothetical protein AXG93_1027s1110 [Marchantia polymorpha subsp. ruderalis]
MSIENAVPSSRRGVRVGNLEVEWCASRAELVSVILHSWQKEGEQLASHKAYRKKERTAAAARGAMARHWDRCLSRPVGPILNVRQSPNPTVGAGSQPNIVSSGHPEGGTRGSGSLGFFE